MKINKTTIWWILAVYTLITIIGAFTGGEAPINPEAVNPGAVNLAAAAGVMVALIFYTRRYVSEKRDLVVKGLVAISILATIVSVVVAIVVSEKGILGNIISNIGSGICSVLLVILANNKRFDFMEECSTKKFVIIILVAALLLPAVMYMLSGLVAFIISIVIVIAFAVLLFSDLGSFMMSNKTPVQTIYRDNKGFMHNTMYDAEKANTKYDAEKKD